MAKCTKSFHITCAQRAVANLKKKSYKSLLLGYHKETFLNARYEERGFEVIIDND